MVVFTVRASKFARLHLRSSFTALCLLTVCLSAAAQSHQQQLQHLHNCFDILTADPTRRFNAYLMTALKNEATLRGINAVGNREDLVQLLIDDETRLEG